MEILDTKLAAMEQLGIRSSAFYQAILLGVCTKPVKMGRASRWPRSEIQAIVEARVAGSTDEEIRELVRFLHARRELYSPPNRAETCSCGASERRIGELSKRAAPQIQPAVEALRRANQRVHIREHSRKPGQTP